VIEEHNIFTSHVYILRITFKEIKPLLKVMHSNSLMVYQLSKP